MHAPHCSIIYNSEDKDATKCLLTGMTKENAVHIHSGALLSDQKECTNHTCNNMEGTPNQCVK